jgi:hypothetical protein
VASESEAVSEGCVRGEDWGRPATHLYGVGGPEATPVTQAVRGAAPAPPARRRAVRSADKARRRRGRAELGQGLRAHVWRLAAWRKMPARYPLLQATADSSSPNHQPNGWGVESWNMVPCRER